MTAVDDFGDLVDFRSLWDFSDPASSEASCRELLPQAQAATHPSYCDELLTQIARAEGLQCKFDDAHRTLDGVESRLDDKPAVVRVRYLLERGRVRNSAGQATDAQPLFLDAWDVAREYELDGLAVDAAHMLAIVEQGEQAVQWNECALDCAEQSNSPAAQQWLGSLYNNLGWTYHDQGYCDKALDLFQRGLSWRRQRGDAQATRIARWSVARAMRSLGRLDQALETQRSLLAELQEAGESDGFVSEEMAECLLSLDRAEEARGCFQQAHELLSNDAWLVESEPDRLARLYELSKAGEA